MKFFITSLFYQIRTFTFTKCYCIFVIGIHVALSLFGYSDYSCLFKYLIITVLIIINLDNVDGDLIAMKLVGNVGVFNVDQYHDDYQVG